MTPSAREKTPEPPNVRSEVHVVNRLQPNHSKPMRPFNHTRIFCQIPWVDSRIVDKIQAEKKKKENEKINFFFINQYCHVMRDTKGRLSHGFVKSFTRTSTSNALRYAERKYHARAARNQYTITAHLIKRIDTPCRLSIDICNHKLHAETCRKQRELMRPASPQ